MSPASNGGSRPRILDLYSGAGGAARGYEVAGFIPVGVDKHEQPRYPYEFHRYDALEILDALVPASWERAAYSPQIGLWFHAIHASPPCQRYSTATKRNGTQDEHPDLIGPTRELLETTGLPYVIENVVGAPLRYAFLVCGTKLGLEADGYRLRRHRIFETSWPWWGWPTIPHGCGCSKSDLPVMDVTGGGPTKKPRTDGGGGRPYKGTADQARRIMGIDWMTKAELNEAIPPAYTEFIGHQLMDHIKWRYEPELEAFTDRRLA